MQTSRKRAGRDAKQAASLMGAQTALCIFIALQLLVWTLVPARIFPNAPLDVIEGFFWGQAWQWGYYKHPPLQAWLLELTYRIFGTKPVGYYLLSQLTVCAAILGVYHTAKRVTDVRRACLSALCLVGVYYFNYTSIEFNPNVLLLPTWAWASYFFVRCAQCGGWPDWLGLGVVLALAAYAKYFSALLALCFILYFLHNASTRKVFTSAKPYVSALLCVLLLSPHLLWLYQNDFAPFVYALSRTENQNGMWTSHLAKPLYFGLAQFGACFISLLLVWAWGWRPRSPSQDQKTLRMVFFLACMPLLITMLSAAATGVAVLTMWGTPLLSFIPLYALLHFSPKRAEKNKINTNNTNNTNKVVARGYLSSALAVMFAIVILLAIVQINGRGFKRYNFPGQTLAQTWERDWPKATPPYAVVGNTWLAGNASFYAQSRPFVFIDADPKKAPWIDPRQLLHKGAVVVWGEGGNPPADLAPVLTAPKAIVLGKTNQRIYYAWT